MGHGNWKKRMIRNPGTDPQIGFALVGRCLCEDGRSHTPPRYTSLQNTTRNYTKIKKLLFKLTTRTVITAFHMEEKKNRWTTNRSPDRL